jgi:hypothetical protein
VTKVMQPGAVSMQPDFDPEGVMLRHGAYLFMTHEAAPWERAESRRSDLAMISCR